MILSPSSAAGDAAALDCSRSDDRALPARWRFARDGILPQRLAREREAVMALHEAIQHGVRDGRADAGTVINDFQQFGPGRPVHGAHAPVVQ